MRTDPPRSTYRLQLHAGFGFADAAAVAAYVDALGASHVYCSPYLQAAPGSTHGYDVVDPTHANDELGGEQGRQRLAATLRELGLGQVLDIVPNHMSVAVPRANPWWWDVLAHGPASRYASYFDVDWDGGDGRVLLPVLGDELADVLKRDELSTDGDVLRYFDHEFPLAAGTSALPLPELLDAQHYRLAYWREGVDRLNYRRFFDVTTLAGVRVEEPAVFDATHAEIRRWLADGSLDALRVDHPDGLADPRAYAERLRALAPDAWLVVEKILEPGERLPEEWPVDGTTGYDALNVLTRLFVDPAGEAPLDACYREFTGETDDWQAVEEVSRRQVLRDILRPELDRLARLASRVTGLADGDARDAIAELVASSPVYRTYLRPGEQPTPDDRAIAGVTLQAALERRPELAPALGAISALVLSGRDAEFQRRFQQTTGAAMAKGVEDTAFYRYTRFVALNEVGGDPSQWSVPIAEFHAYCAARQRAWPLTMTTLSTHDTKRGEDVRARLAVLAQLPEEWAAAVRRWSARADAYRTGDWPDRRTEYLLWQVLAGAHPLPYDRAAAYAEKACREAKTHTSWLDPDPAYEDAVKSWLAGVTGDAELQRDLDAFVAPLRVHGWVTSLAQKLVQLTMPGVPDVYQGSELWDLSLVDPDNRRPVDYDTRRALLAEAERLTAAGLDHLGERAEDGLPKLVVVARALRLRRARPALFGPEGSYQPLPATGIAANHVVAFARGGGSVTVVPRLAARVDDWGDTSVLLPPGRWRDQFGGRLLDGGPVLVTDLLDRFPVALLATEDA